MPSDGFISVLVFLFGLAIGSFLNVCIRRLPGGKSVVKPASACPNCGAPIKPYDNIPVISYLLLRGKCRACRAPISPLYPFVEVSAGILFLACFRVFGFGLEALKWSAFSALMIVLVFTDLRDRLLPDAVNFTGLGIGLAFSLVTPSEDHTASLLANRWFAYPPPEAVLSFVDALLGAAVGGGVLWLISEGYFRLREKEGMGLGDVKMMVMAGAFLGFKRTVLTLLAGSLLGTVLGLAFILARKKTSQYELPFGTFLGMAALLVVFFGTPIVNWYQSLLVPR